MNRFNNRVEGGVLLAEILHKYAQNSQVVVAGIPRGGVVTANEVACALQVPLTLIVTKKISAPGQPELAIGAVAQDETVILDDALITSLELTKNSVNKSIELAQSELQRRLIVYRQFLTLAPLENKIVIIVDDGIATGATMKAAIVSARKAGALKVIVATPVVSQHVMDEVGDECDELYMVMLPDYFPGVGFFYQQFASVEDEEVLDILRRAQGSIQ